MEVDSFCGCYSQFPHRLQIARVRTRVACTADVRSTRRCARLEIQHVVERLTKRAIHGVVDQRVVGVVGYHQEKRQNVQQRRYLEPGSNHFHNVDDAGGNVARDEHDNHDEQRGGDPDVVDVYRRLAAAQISDHRPMRLDDFVDLPIAEQDDAKRYDDDNEGER